MEETESPKSVQQSRCQYNQQSIKSIYLGQKEPTRIRSRRMKPPKNQNQNQTKKGKRIWRSSRKEKKPLKTKPKESCLYHQLLPSLLFSSLLAFSSFSGDWGSTVLTTQKGHQKRGFLALLRWPGTRRRNCGNAITWMFQSLTLLNPQRFTLPNNFRSSLSPRRKVFKIFFFNIISVTVMWVLLLLFYVFWFSVWSWVWAVDVSYSSVYVCS